MLGATKSLQNARALLDDSKLLFMRERYGTSYALAIFALEETAKGFVFHWVADGKLTETDLKKLIYNHRRKHATIQLTNFFERRIPLLLSKLKPLLNGKRRTLTLGLEEAKTMFMTALRQSQDQLHLLIHAQQRREISLYVGICPICNRELWGPWLITAPDVDELIGYVEKHLLRMESLVRNCKSHESQITIEGTAPLSPLVRLFVNSLEKAAETKCKHVLCSNAKHPCQNTHGKTANS